MAPSPRSRLKPPPGRKTPRPSTSTRSKGDTGLPLIAALAHATPGCGQPDAAAGEGRATGAAIGNKVTVTGIIDHANLLDPAAEGRVAVRVRALSDQMRRPVLFVLIRPTGGE